MSTPVSSPRQSGPALRRLAGRVHSCGSATPSQPRSLTGWRTISARASLTRPSSTAVSTGPWKPPRWRTSPGCWPTFLTPSPASPSFLLAAGAAAQAGPGAPRARAAQAQARAAREPASRASAPCALAPRPGPHRGSGGRDRGRGPRADAFGRRLAGTRPDRVPVAAPQQQRLPGQQSSASFHSRTDQLRTTPWRTNGSPAANSSAAAFVAKSTIALAPSVNGPIASSSPRCAYSVQRARCAGKCTGTSSATFSPDS